MLGAATVARGAASVLAVRAVAVAPGRTVPLVAAVREREVKKG
jgi:hypothetical protein